MEKTLFDKSEPILLNHVFISVLGSLMAPRTWHSAINLVVLGRSFYLDAEPDLLLNQN